MTPIAEKLIHDLRHDEHTREHFSLSAWHGRGTCNTVGCIAGTAIFLARKSEDIYLPGPQRIQALVSGHGSYSDYGAELLGLEGPTAEQLFLPWEYWAKPLFEGRNIFNHLPTQGRPSLETVEAMKAFASNLTSWLLVTPDRAALALERIVKDEVLYCDWAYAFENA